jgi:hypothetical protein
VGAAAEVQAAVAPQGTGLVGEDFLTFYADPGEDFGWAIGCGTKLVSAGTTKMWTTADMLWDALENDDASEFLAPAFLRDDVELADYATMSIKRIVCEDWRLYPNKMKSLAWDRCRTARVIGSLTQAGRRFDIPLILQPAAIKPAAVAAGAEELYYRPLHENRHQNDAIQHYVFYTSTELLGLKLPVFADNTEDST